MFNEWLHFRKALNGANMFSTSLLIECNDAVLWKNRTTLT